MTWTLGVGDTARRTDIQAVYRGSHSRGISAPKRIDGAVDIMLWWRAGHASPFGYKDGWSTDGAFYFAGTGQVGDQRFGAPNSENGRIRDHAANGDRLRLLKYVANTANLVTYVGEFRLDPDAPWQWYDGTDPFGDRRRIIQFRMLPVGDVLREPGDVVRQEPGARATASPLPELGPATPVDLEALRTPEFRRVVVARSEAVRRLELILVHDFKRWLGDACGLDSSGINIPYEPERAVLRGDLFISEPRVLVEAKASTAREHMRMAIGQLLDYARYVKPRPGLCVLTLSRPAEDMLALIRSLGMDAAWKNFGPGFDGTAPWLGR